MDWIVHQTRNPLLPGILSACRRDRLEGRADARHEWKGRRARVLRDDPGHG